MTVNRYHVDCYAFYDSARLDVTKCDDGDYVLFEDYVALQERVEKLEACACALRAICESADKNQAAVNTALLTDARKAVEELL